ncbi:complex I NDUFA9 subunit family protein [Mesorhizobium sp. B3-1-9]|uniref:complex I NDUFA9 subunit family protein n=1 Tax=unclassified Mesorhizobium TaxID=325217 RepID=UPI001128FC5F|nr:MULTISPECIES: complex I NDUFA9 subunit family protein [unclassified Mesorhizobium]TPI38187.1 complex I NDUFA9 subunit family protein [Mesorhizobium sp. B3-1-9]TPJ24235.1 complex I NDUFA9 subunit family protein [Mesorhizobium sp. B2-8-3]
MAIAQTSSSNTRPRSGCVTVFGGSGFLGRRIVRHLLDHGLIVRSASRHPAHARPGWANGKSFSAVKADILDRSQVAAAVSDAATVVNAVSLYSEHGDVTFERIHVEAASQLADAAREGGAERYIQISGIGSDSRSQSSYIRARGQGEEAVNVGFPGATIVRPAVMTATDDRFLTTITRLLPILPAYPLFGDGDTRLQPASVEDVAEAIARIASGGADARLFEFGGPRVYTYRTLVLEVAQLLGIKTRLVPVPFVLWRILATFGEFIPGAPLTRNQVDLMQIDTVADTQLPGFRDLGIEPHDIDQVLRSAIVPAGRTRASRR